MRTLAGVAIVSLVALLISACGSSATTTDRSAPKVDGGVRKDAAKPADRPKGDTAIRKDAAKPVDAGVAKDAAKPGDGGSACVKADFGPVGPVSGEVFLGDDPDPTTYIGWEGKLQGSDYLAVELVQEFGVFTDAIKTGTFPLTGDETNYGTCGLCVVVLGDYDPVTNVGSFYMATGGTVTLSSVSGRLTGTFDKLTFTHVTIDRNDYTSTPVGDCDTKVGAGSFDAVIP